MYTKKQIEGVSEIIKRIARENHITEAELRTYMKEAMESGRNNPDPLVQAEWAGFDYAGDEPTIEEFILWVSETC